MDKHIAPKWVKAIDRLPKEEGEYCLRGFGEYYHVARFVEGEFYEKGKAKLIPFAFECMEWLEDA